MSPRKWRYLIALLVLGSCVGCFGLVWIFDAFDDIELLGTEKDERDFSKADQRKLFDTFFPVPVPESATDVRIHYQGFQEWQLDISFTLPPGDFETFVAQLTPKPDEPGTYVGRTQLVDGGFLADGSSITVEPGARRVKLTAFTW